MLWPVKAALLEPFGKQAKTLTVPSPRFDQSHCTIERQGLTENVTDLKQIRAQRGQHGNRYASFI